LIIHTLASGSPLPGFLNSLAGPLNHYGLLAVLFFVLIEDFGIPVPGETILIAAAIYAGSGRLNVVAVGIIGFVAAVTGDNIGFAIGHFGGRALVLRWGRLLAAGAPGYESSRMRSAAIQATAMVGAAVLPATWTGSTEASTTRNPVTPRTRSRGSTTSSAAGPMALAPTA
jgi:membrane protein DedA with SNARE-associated domain